LILGANNGLPDSIALYLVDGFAKLVIALGPHPMTPLELYMNKGDRLDDRTWHTVQVIRERKVRQLHAVLFGFVVWLRLYLLYWRENRFRSP